MRGRIFGIAYAAVLFVGALFWYAWVGISFDDICYTREFTATSFSEVEDFCYCRGEKVTTVGQVIDSFILHAQYWGNARLGSLLMFAFNLLPRWIVVLLDAAGLAAFFVLSMRVAFGRRWSARPLACMVLTAMLWWVLPWDEFMLVTAFAVNYIWCTALYLWLYLLLAERRGATWAVCVFGFLAACVHEGLASGFCVMLLCICLPRLIKRGWNTHLMLPCICFAAGTMLVICNPALLTRFNNLGAGISGLNTTNIYHLLTIREWIFPCFLATLPLFFIKMGRERFMRRMHALWPMVAGAMGAYLLQVCGECWTERSAWAGDTFLLIALMRLLSTRAWPRRRLALYAGYVLLAGMAVWMGAIASIQYRLMRERTEIEREYLAGNKIIYKDALRRASLPWWSLYLPLSVFESHICNWCDLAREHGMVAEPWANVCPVVLPERYRGVKLESIPPLKGNAGFRNIGNILYGRNIGNEVVVWNTYCSEGNEDGSFGRRVPWIKWRQHRFPQPFTCVNEVKYDVHKVLVGSDTLYFYVTNSFNFPSQLYGLSIVAVDTIPQK